MSILFGVSVGRSSLVVCAAEARWRTVRTIESVTYSIPDGGEERDQRITEILTQWKKKHNPAGMVIGLPLSAMTVATVMMPPLAHDDLKRALSFELEKHLPLGADEYHFDYTVPPGSAAGSARKIIVAAVRKKHYEDSMRPFVASGITIASLTCTSLAVFTGIQSIEKEGMKTGLFLFAADGALEMFPIENGFLTAMHRVPLDGTEAEAVESAMKRFPGPLVIAGRKTGGPIEKLGARVVEVDPAVSMVRMHFLYPQKGFNFLPSEQRKKRKDYYQPVAFTLGIASLALFLLTGVTVYIKDRSALASVHSRTEAIRKEAVAVLELRKQYDQIMKDREALSAFLSNRNMTMQALSDLSMTVPQSVWIVSLSVDDKGKVELEGIATKTSDLIKALEKSGKFTSISFTMPITYKGNEERFALKMEILR